MRAGAKEGKERTEEFFVRLFVVVVFVCLFLKEEGENGRKCRQ